MKEVVSEAQPVKSKTIKNKRKLEEQQQPTQKKRRFVVDVSGLFKLYVELYHSKPAE